MCPRSLREAEAGRIARRLARRSGAKVRYVHYLLHGGQATGPLHALWRLAREPEQTIYYGYGGQAAYNVQVITGLFDPIKEDWLPQPTLAYRALVRLALLRLVVLGLIAITIAVVVFRRRRTVERPPKAGTSDGGD